MALPLHLLLVLPTAPQDLDAALLERRLAEPVPPTASAPDPHPGHDEVRVLFTRRGDDNANAVLARPDADGDGTFDVVVAWDLFHSGDNLETAAGAGFDDGDALWSLVTQDGLSGGYFSDPDQLAAFPDVTGDGVDELLTGTSGGGRAATLYDGATGAVLQSFDTYLGPESGWVYQALPVPDLNGNSTPDFVLVTGSNADSVYAVDGGKTGVHHDEIWSFQAADGLFAVELIGNVDADGVPDLAVAAIDNADTVYALSGATGLELWSTPISGSPQELTAYVDGNSDGANELVVSAWDGGAAVQLLDGKTGGVLWTSPAVGTFGMDAVVIGDVTNDGRPEIAAASWADFVVCVSGADGSLVWTTARPPAATSGSSTAWTT